MGVGRLGVVLAAGCLASERSLFAGVVESCPESVVGVVAGWAKVVSTGVTAGAGTVDLGLRFRGFGCVPIAGDAVSGDAVADGADAGVIAGTASSCTGGIPMNSSAALRLYASADNKEARLVGAGGSGISDVGVQRRFRKQKAAGVTRRLSKLRVLGGLGAVRLPSVMDSLCMTAVTVRACPGSESTAPLGAVVSWFFSAS